MAPIRISNLARLDLERHLVRPGRGKGLHIVIEPEEVKNREPLEYPLPAESVQLIECYLRYYRSYLAPLSSTALFPGRGGGPKNPQALGLQICQTIRDHTGLLVHPHLFRHIAGKLYLDANPGAYEVIRRVLGHRSIDTTTSFYTGLETAAAVRHFDDILKLRPCDQSVPTGKGVDARRSTKWPTTTGSIWPGLRPGDVFDLVAAILDPHPPFALRRYGRWLNWLDCCGLLNEPDRTANRIARIKFGLCVSAGAV
jgi:hypothetical protein